MTEQFNIRCFSLDGGNLLRTLVGHRGSVTCLHYSPELRILMSGGVDHVLNMWLPQRGEVCLLII